jgi:hypothetical protein
MNNNPSRKAWFKCLSTLKSNIIKAKMLQLINNIILRDYMNRLRKKKILLNQNKKILKMYCRGKKLRNRINIKRK